MIDASVLQRLRESADSHGLKYEVDNERPWGGELIFNDDQLDVFMAAYFPEISKQKTYAQPKFLIIAPHQRFSWQYHHKRGEVWHILEGPVGIITSTTDIEPKAKVYPAGELISVTTEERHRMVGQDMWGVVAELWVHADPADPSVESDNVRVQDDYNRS